MINYFTKYYNKFKQIGGELLGEGSFGRVISNPIPQINGPILINDDTNLINYTAKHIQEIITNNYNSYYNTSAAKFFCRKKDYKKEVALMYLIEIKIFPKISELVKSKKLPHDFFCSRYAEGNINFTDIFNNRQIYTNNWFGIGVDSNLRTSLEQYYHKIIIYEKGKPFLQERNILICLRGLLLLSTLFYELSLLKIYIPDTKLNNLIIDKDNNIKLIDYAYMNYYTYIYAEYIEKKEINIYSLIFRPTSFDYQCLFSRMRVIDILSYEKELVVTINLLNKQQQSLTEGSREYKENDKLLKIKINLQNKYNEIELMYNTFIDFLKNFKSRKSITEELLIKIPLKKIDGTDYELVINLQNHNDIENAVRKCFIIINLNQHENYIIKLTSTIDIINLSHQQLYSYGIMLLTYLINNESSIGIFYC